MIAGGIMRCGPVPREQSAPAAGFTSMAAVTVTASCRSTACGRSWEPRHAEGVHSAPRRCLYACRAGFASVAVVAVISVNERLAKALDERHYLLCMSSVARTLLLAVRCHDYGSLMNIVGRLAATVARSSGNYGRLMNIIGRLAAMLFVPWTTTRLAQGIVMTFALTVRQLWSSLGPPWFHGRSPPRTSHWSTTTLPRLPELREESAEDFDYNTLEVFTEPFTAYLQKLPLVWMHGSLPIDAALSSLAGGTDLQLELQLMWRRGSPHETAVKTILWPGVSLFGGADLHQRLKQKIQNSSTCCFDNIPPLLAGERHAAAAALVAVLMALLPSLAGGTDLHQGLQSDWGHCSPEAAAETTTWPEVSLGGGAAFHQRLKRENVQCVLHFASQVI